MGTANQGWAYSIIAALGSRRRTEYTEWQTHTHKDTQTRYKFKCAGTCTCGPSCCTSIQPQNFKDRLRTAPKSNPNDFAKLFIDTWLTCGQRTSWWHRHITHKHRCACARCSQLSPYVVMWDCCMHTLTEEQKCINNLSVCALALRSLGLLNGNDPVGHHEVLVHARQQMVATSSC